MEVEEPGSRPSDAQALLQTQESGDTPRHRERGAAGRTGGRGRETPRHQEGQRQRAWRGDKGLDRQTGRRTEGEGGEGGRETERNRGGSREEEGEERGRRSSPGPSLCGLGDPGVLPRACCNSSCLLSWPSRADTLSTVDSHHEAGSCRLYPAPRWPAPPNTAYTPTVHYFSRDSLSPPGCPPQVRLQGPPEKNKTPLSSGTWVHREGER